MRILLDAVVTTADPNRCSTNIQFLTFVRRVLAERDDVFFYWLVPDWITDEDFEATYPQDPRVSYHRVPQHKDRSKEYFTISKEVDNAIAFNGGLWDYDVLLTMRTGLVPLYRLIMNSPRTSRLAWLKEVWLIEEMPLMDFKKTVMTINREVQDLYKIAGYLAADRVYILSYHEKQHIMRRARDYLTATNVMKLDKIKPVITSQFDDFSLKDPSAFPDPENGKPFCMAFAGRIASSSSITEINKIMVSTFVMKGEKVRLLVTTPSAMVKTFDESVIDIRMAGRDEFWELCRDHMHVIINMATEGGFLLSLVEPMMMGVPAIVGREDWSEALLGPDFPFYVTNEVQAYALAGMFYDDYEGMYARWTDWYQEHFVPMMRRRFAEDLLYDHLLHEVATFGDRRARIKDTNPDKEDNRFLLDFIDHVGDADEFVFRDVVESMVKAGKVDRNMLDKLRPGDRDHRGLAFCTPWNDFRVCLQEFYGWEDASVEVGHMRKARSEA